MDIPIIIQFHLHTLSPQLQRLETLAPPFLLLSVYSGRMAINPRKDGGPNTKFYESQETLAQLDNAKTWLMKHAKKVIYLIIM